MVHEMRRELKILIAVLIALISLIVAALMIPVHSDEKPPLPSVTLVAVATTTSLAVTTTSSTTTTTIPAPTTTTLPIPATNLWGSHGSTEYGRCTQWEPLLAALAPEGGWNVDKFSRIMWRESRCFANVRSRTNDSGLLQINDVWLDDLSLRFNRPITPTEMFDPVINIQSAAMICFDYRRQGKACEKPWGGTGK